MQRHRLENPLVTERRILILLFPRAGALARIFLLVVPVLFNHKNDLNPHTKVCEPLTRNQPLLSPSVQQEAEEADSMAGTRQRASRAISVDGEENAVGKLLKGKNSGSCAATIRMEPTIGLEPLTCRLPSAYSPGGSATSGHKPMASRRRLGRDAYQPV